MTESNNAIKCVVYGAGFVGQELARLIDEKGWQLVAVYNRAGDKVGRDIGEVAGLGRTLGVVVEDCDRADYSALEADVAFVATTNILSQNMPAYERLLGAGINVLCHGTEAYLPYWIDPELAGKIDALAKKHGVTFTGGGIWDASRIWSGLLATGPCVNIRSLLHKTQTECLRQGFYWADVLGVGLPPDEWRTRMKASQTDWGKSVQIPSVSVVQKLGYTIDVVTNGFEPVVRDYDFYCTGLKKSIKAGTALGMRFLVDLVTREGVTARTEYEARVFEDDEVEQMQWIIDGKPGNEVHFIRKDSGVASAACLLNRTADVLSAPSGIVDIIQHGPLKASVVG
ncbi:MAG: hypothetical protein M0Q95_15775 [Porticoccaceae bacterium]|nr:hypothetical protein [Porticoccaceae bacterium]